MKYFTIIILFIQSNVFFCQEKNIDELISEFNNTKVSLNGKVHFKDNILDGKLECRNYFFIKNQSDTICFYGLKKTENFIVFLRLGNKSNIEKEIERLAKLKDKSFGSNAPNQLLIYSKKSEDFFLITCSEGGYTEYSKKGIEYNLFFDIFSPIIILDSKLNLKYCFFDTEEDGDLNLAYFEFIQHENYFQINTFAQIQRKNINVKELKFNNLKDICTRETVLIKKEYYRYNKMDIFKIYDQLINHELIPARSNTLQAKM